MSETKRWTYFVVFLVVFLVMTPIVILYAMGYRFEFAQKFLVTERGGVYVYASVPGTKIYIGSELRDTTGIFNREYLSQNIKPGRYFVKAENEGYRPWDKYVQVDPQKVVSVYPFLVPIDFEFRKIPALVESISPSATTTVTTLVSNDTYEQYIDLFDSLGDATTTTATTADSVSLDIQKEEDQIVLQRIFGNVQVWFNRNENSFYAEWVARGDFLPSYFCENSECVNPFVFLEVNSPVNHFDFYPGRDDVIIFSVEGGSIHAAELDKRPQQMVVEIYRGKNEEETDFRLAGRNTLVIKDGEEILVTELTR